MRASVVSAAFAAIGSVSALPQEIPNSRIAPALPLDVFNTPRVVYPVPFTDAHESFEIANLTGSQGPDLLGVADGINSVVEGLTRVGGDISRLIDSDLLHLRSVTEDGEKVSEDGENVSEDGENVSGLEKRATCSTVRVRTEWDSYSNARRQAYVNAIKCLMSRRPNGQFPNSKSRWEDLVALHQLLTPNIHGNAKFLVWHRYFLWTYEDMLRTECGFNDAIPWFDETRYAGRFTQSSIFSNEWFGSIDVRGGCVTNGQFANTVLNIGPGTSNQPHCLSRNNDDAKTANCNSGYVNQCNSWADYNGMGSCVESGPHAWGHNGIGAVMQDVFGSPSDISFYFHHAFVDRNFRIWTNADPARLNTINGNDVSGRPITLDTTLNVYDFRPTVRIRDVMDTTSAPLCYRYNY